ncbi:MAG: NADH-quinone oxidoreductase subunit C [Desulfovibrionales bacterium]|nr:NADH-quinone oxidoreductase subunit C [Desulfovibrionales bacterium]
MSAHFLQDLPCLFTAAQDPLKTGLTFSVLLPPDQVREAARLCRGKGYHLEDVTVSEVQEGTLVLYHYDHFDRPGRICCMALSADNSFDSIADIFPGADWHERECCDFFGTAFAGHPNLIPLLLPPDAQTPPLKKQDGNKVPLTTIFPWAQAPATLEEA